MISDSYTEGRPTHFDEAHPVLVTEMVEPGHKIQEIRQELSSRLPRLLGWTVLLMGYSPPKQTKGGILLPDQVDDANRYLSNVFQVVTLGPLAFTHPKLRGGAKTTARQVENQGGHEVWTDHEQTDFAPGVEPPKEDDWVIVRRYSGLSLVIVLDSGEEVSLKLCNDDDILAVIDSPRGWKAYVE